MYNKSKSIRMEVGKLKRYDTDYKTGKIRDRKIYEKNPKDSESIIFRRHKIRAGRKSPHILNLTGSMGRALNKLKK